MTKSTCLLLKDILLKTFFDFAMFEILPYNGNARLDPQEVTVYSIKTETPEEFRLNFFFPRTIQLKIVQSIFEKSPEEITEEQISDCIMEIVNIVAGNFFTEYFKENTTFNMGLPHIYDNTNNAKDCQCCLNFTIDDELFKVELF